MALALHHPEVGYYALRSPLGAQGDYYTSPELHPAFAALLGRQVEQLWKTLGRPSPFVVHEAGPGSGRFARDLLDWLGDSRSNLYGAMRYQLDESSDRLRHEQREALLRGGHANVAWVRGFDAGSPHLVLANELLDALPVHLVEGRAEGVVELFVALEDGRLALVEGPLSTPALYDYFARLGLWPAPGCRAEVNLAALDWMRAAGAAIERGLLIVLDYGYPATALYAPDRRAGTLLCYEGHTLNSDPLRRVGQQDITSHVDFTSVARAGEEVGLGTLGLVSQHRLLRNLGWDSLRQRVQQAALGQAELQANLRALDALVDPDGLGRVLALVQQRGLADFAPIGLVGGPRPDWRRLALRGPEHVRLPDPAELEGLPDFEAQWSELFGEDAPD